MMIKKSSYKAHVDISHIVSEVKKHGFYSSYCDNFAYGVSTQNELILMIKILAKSANLNVSFNVKESICIFEALTN